MYCIFVACGGPPGTLPGGPCNGFARLWRGRTRVARYARQTVARQLVVSLVRTKTEFVHRNCHRWTAKEKTAVYVRRLVIVCRSSQDPSTARAINIGQTPVSRPSGRSLVYQFDASRRGKKRLKFSSDKNEGTYRSRKGAEQPDM